MHMSLANHKFIINFMFLPEVSRLAIIFLLATCIGHVSEGDPLVASCSSPTIMLIDSKNILIHLVRNVSIYIQGFRTGQPSAP